MIQSSDTALERVLGAATMLRTLPPLPVPDEALRRLLGALAADGYRFVTPTPATQARVLSRPERLVARSVRDALGWSLPFARGTLPATIEDALDAGDALTGEDEARVRSLFRVSSLHDRLFLHSAYPTEAADAVFFGPDSYRFADLIVAELGDGCCPPAARIVDIGCGAGVGAIVAAGCCPGAEIIASDVNRAALRLARINAAAAGVAMTTMKANGLEGIDGRFDVILINPPYMADAAKRAYRDGGGLHGGRLSLDLAAQAAARLMPGGRVILYTGSAIVDGEDALRSTLGETARAHGCTLRYRELDPDVFGEELETPAYRDVERIALVAAVLTAAG